MHYLLGSIVGSMVCSIIGFAIAEIVAKHDPFAMLFLGIVWAIPLGTLLGIVSVYLAKNKEHNFTSSKASITAFYYFGGFLGSMIGVYIAAQGRSGWYLLLGLFFGGMLAMLLVNRLLKKYNKEIEATKKL